MRFTPRKDGVRRVTKRIEVHLSESEVRWVALQLGCSLDTAASAMVSLLKQRMAVCGETWVVSCGELALTEYYEEELGDHDMAIYVGDAV